MSYAWSVADRSLKLLKSIPELHALYAGVESIESGVDLLSIPTLSEANFCLAMKSLYRSSLPAAPCYVFMSSGTSGEPKLAFQPRGQCLADIAALWNPLAEIDRRVLIDFSGGGKAWSANHFFRELALNAGFAYLHIGNLYTKQELDATWRHVIELSDAAAICGNPTQLGFVAAYFAERKIRIESVEAILWSGEPLKQFHEEVLRAAFPNGRCWSVYGGTEPWVIGYQRPDMPRDEFMVLPYQHLEVLPDKVLVTSLHPAILTPVLRYELFDRLELVDARSATRRIRILGRADRRVCLGGNNISADTIVASVNKMEGVLDSQVVFHRVKGAVTSVEIRLIREGAGANIAADRITETVMLADFQNRVLEGRLFVNLTDAPILNARTGKCPAYAFQDG